MPAYRIVDPAGCVIAWAAGWQIREAELRDGYDERYEPERDYQAIGRQGWIGVRYNGAGL